MYIVFRQSEICFDIFLAAGEADYFKAIICRNKGQVNGINTGSAYIEQVMDMCVISNDREGQNSDECNNKD